MKAGVTVSFWRLAFQLSRASISASSFTERDATSNEECKMANATREQRKNIFFKLDNAMGLSYKLQTGSEFYLKCLRFGWVFLERERIWYRFQTESIIKRKLSLPIRLKLVKKLLKKISKKNYIEKKS